MITNKIYQLFLIYIAKNPKAILSNPLLIFFNFKLKNYNHLLQFINFINITQTNNINKLF